VGGYLEVDARAENILQHNILPMVVLVDNIADVLPTYDKYKAISSDKSILGDVLTMQNLIPKDQEKKIALFKDIVNDVPDKKRRHLKGKTKKYFNEVINK
jgi:hypothetical protein